MKATYRSTSGRNAARSVQGRAPEQDVTVVGLGDGSFADYEISFDGEIVSASSGMMDEMTGSSSGTGHVGSGGTDVWTGTGAATVTVTGGEGVRILVNGTTVGEATSEGESVEVPAPNDTNDRDNNNTRQNALPFDPMLLALVGGAGVLALLVALLA